MKQFDQTSINPDLSKAICADAIRQVANVGGLSLLRPDELTAKICKGLWIGPHCKAAVEVKSSQSTWMTLVFIKSARLLEEVPTSEMEYYLTQANPALALASLKSQLARIQPHHNPIIEIDNMSVDAGVHATVDVKLRLTAVDVNQLFNLLYSIVQIQVD